MSNKFSQKRQTLPRPKVCKSKPPKPGAPDVMTCELSPASGTISPFGEFVADFTAHDPAEDDDANLTISADVACGAAISTPSFKNGSTTEVKWMDFGCSSPQSVTFTATSPSGAECSSTAEVTIT